MGQLESPMPSCGVVYTWQRDFGLTLDWSTVLPPYRGDVYFNGLEVNVNACKPGIEGWVLTDDPDWPFLRASDEPPYPGNPKFYFGNVTCRIVMAYYVRWRYYSSVAGSTTRTLPYRH